MKNQGSHDTNPKKKQSLFFIFNHCVLIIAAVVFFFALFASKSHAECNKIYAKVGAGYKFAEKITTETDIGEINIVHHSPLAARLEIGEECGKITWGVAHYSQWFDGAPFNNRKELVVNEVFLDYKFEWNI